MASLEEDKALAREQLREQQQHALQLVNDQTVRELTAQRQVAVLQHEVNEAMHLQRQTQSEQRVALMEIYNQHTALKRLAGQNPTSAATFAKCGSDQSGEDCERVAKTGESLEQLLARRRSMDGSWASRKTSVLSSTSVEFQAPPPTSDLI